MSRPDWDYWDAITEFDCRDAAWLWFGEERPRDLREPDYPDPVRNLLNRIRSERDALQRKDNHKRVYRQTLVSIADSVDRRTPLLHPEARRRPPPELREEDSAVDHEQDYARCLLVMIEALIRLHRKRPTVLRLSATEQIRQLLNSWDEVQPVSKDGDRPWDGEIPLSKGVVVRHLRRIHRGEPL